MLVNSKPESDYAVIFNTASSFSAGDISSFNVGPGAYYDVWAYQSVYTLYQALVLYIYNSIDALKILNVLFMSGSCVLVYKISSTIYSANISFIVACLYALYPEMIFYSPVLTNQHLSTFFALGGVYFLFKRNYLSLICAGLFLSIANLMRPEIIIIFIAVSFCLVIFCCKGNNRNEEFKKIAKFALVVFIYVATNMITSAAIKVSGVNKYGIDNMNPEWKFMVGLDKEHDGTWNTSHAYILKMQDSAERRKEVINYVKSTYNSTYDIFHFVYRKQSFMWSSFSPIYFTFNDGELTRVIRLFGKEYYMNDLVNIFVSVDKIYYIIILGLFFISVIDALFLVVKKRQLPPALYFIMMVCLVNFIIYLFIEVQPRYKYFVMPFIFVAVAHALTRLSLFWTEKLRTQVLRVKFILNIK